MNDQPFELDDDTDSPMSGGPDGQEGQEVMKAWPQGQVLPIGAGEDWKSPESDGTSLATIAEEVGATRQNVIAGIWDLAQNGTKEISDGDGWSITVNNDALKLEALKTLSKIYMDEKKNKKQKAKWIHYVLIRDGN